MYIYSMLQYVFMPAYVYGKTSAYIMFPWAEEHKNSVYFGC